MTGFGDRRKKQTFQQLVVRRAAGNRSRGWLFIGSFQVPVTLGDSGIRANKREGDGATPRGCFRPLRLWWRADRLRRPQTLLPVRCIRPDDAWCENAADRRYNRPIQANGIAAGDRLWRHDHLYDLVIEIDHNVRPRVAGRGSAVFIHIARPDRGPTAGCIAVSRGPLLRLLRRIGSKTRICIQS